MKRRWIKVFLVFLAVTTILLLGSVFGIFHTSSGAKMLLSFIESRLNGSLIVEGVDGSFSAGLEIDEIEFRDLNLTINVGKARVVASPEFFPLHLKIKVIDISTVRIRQGIAGAEIARSENTGGLEGILASLVLPVPLIVSKLEVGRIEFLSPSGELLISAENISSAFQLHNVLEIEHLELESDRSRIELAGSLGLSAPYPVMLNCKASMVLNAETTGSLEEIDIQASLSGELEKSLKIEMTSVNPELTIKGHLQKLLNNPTWDLTLKSPEIFWPRAVGENPANEGFSIESLTIISRGRVGDHVLESRSILHVPGLDSARLEFRGGGDETGMEITTFELSGRQLELSAQGDIRWQNEPAIRLNALLDRLDLSGLLTGWPEKHQLQGRINLALGKGRLEIPLMQFLIPDTNTHLDATATINLDQGVVEADIVWSGIVWPTADENPVFSSPHGNANLSGSPENWVLRGNSTIQTAGFPPGQISVEAKGNRESAEINIVNGQVLGGDIGGNVEFNWGRKLDWSAHLNATKIETGILFPDWPGFLNTELKTDGGLEPFRFSLEIIELDGEILNRPVAGSGQLHWQEKQQLDVDFHLSLGKSTLQFQGKLFEADGLVFSVNIDDFGSFLPSGSGSLQANGLASLAPGKPRLRLNLDAEQLEWSGISVQELSIHDISDLPADGIAGLLIEASQIEINKQSVDNFSLEIFADQERLSAMLTASGSDIGFSTKLNGQLNDWQYLTQGNWTEAGWNGHIESLTLSKRGQISLQLEQAARLQLSLDNTVLDNACIRTSDAQNICLNAQWQRNGAYSAKAVLNEFPLNMVHEFLDTELIFTQQLNGNISMAGAMNQLPTGQARIEISPGKIDTRSESGAPLVTGPGIVHFSLERGKLVTGALEVPLPGNGNIDIDFQLPDITQGVDIQIDGHAVVTLNDLGAFSPWFPYFDQLGGIFDASLAASGDALHPVLSGNVSIRDGIIQHDISGLNLHEIQLRGQLLSGRNTHLTGSFKAHDGSGKLTADIDLSDVFSPRFKMTLTGDSLTLFDSPEFLLVIEPDITLGWHDNAIEINGQILIPKARIAPKTLPTGTHSESDDLVIVAGEIPGSDEDRKPDAELAIRGKLEIILGDDIELDLGLAVAHLDGSTTFTWQNALMPLATGRYGIVGEINAFGQQLSITEGVISFPGVPANNPHLDIRAERKIYGNSEIRRAGVFINGTLRRMIVEPYTDPMTSRERAQTLLITGSDFNMEQGVGAVNIGTYIAPRFYLSYGIGVFEDENVISLRFDLGQRWGIKATSGQRTTGIDINYIIER